MAIGAAAGRTATMDGVRRLIAAIVLTLTVLVGPSAALAQDDATTTTSIPESGRIIPEVNSGTEPTDAGDRGGSLQSVVFVIVIVGVGVIGTLVVRESRKARAARGF